MAKLLGAAPANAQDAATKLYVDTSKTTLHSITATTYTASPNDLVEADATSNSITITVPNTLGAQVIVKRVDTSANTVTVTPSSGTIDGQANMTLVGQNTVMRVIGDGTNVKVQALIKKLTGGSGVAITYDAAGNTDTVSDGPMTINAPTASYTLVLADAPKFIAMNVGTANTLTVPPNVTVAFPVGTVIEGAQIGAGQTTLNPAPGVTINGTPGLKVAAQYGSFALIKTATDTWLAIGRLSA